MKTQTIAILVLVLLLAGVVVYYQSCKPETVTLQRDSVAQAKIDSLEAVSDHRQYIEDSLIAVIDSLRGVKKQSIVIYNQKQSEEEIKPASSLYFDLNKIKHSIRRFNFACYFRIFKFSRNPDI